MPGRRDIVVDVSDDSAARLSVVDVRLSAVV